MSLFQYGLKIFKYQRYSGIYSCFLVFQEFEGGKPVPNEIEKLVKDKIEAELKEVNAKTIHVPIVEFSKSFKQCLPERKIYIDTKNGEKELVHTLGPFNADGEYSQGCNLHFLGTLSNNLIKML